MDAWKSGSAHRSPIEDDDLGLGDRPSGAYLRHSIRTAARESAEFDAKWRQDNIGGQFMSLDWSRKGGKGVHIDNIKFANSTIPRHDCIDTEK